MVKNLQIKEILLKRIHKLEILKSKNFFYNYDEDIDDEV